MVHLMTLEYAVANSKLMPLDRVLEMYDKGAIGEVDATVQLLRLGDDGQEVDFDDRSELRAKYENFRSRDRAEVQIVEMSTRVRWSLQEALSNRTRSRKQ